MLRNPIIARDAKLRTLRQLFQGKVQELTLAFFEIIVRKQREDILLSVAREFHLLYNAVKQIDNALLITAVPVSDEIRQRVVREVKEITGHEVDLTEKVDPEIIGGFVLRINDKQIDDSVRSRIDELRYLFSKNPYVKEF
jgi:F-type H+-transporting ATPase subunit delta